MVSIILVGFYFSGALGRRRASSIATRGSRLLGCLKTLRSLALCRRLYINLLLAFNPIFLLFGLLTIGSSVVFSFTGRNIIHVLGKDADRVICFLYYRHLRKYLCLELSFLFFVCTLTNVFDLEPWIVEQVCRRRPGVVVDVKTTLEKIEVLASHPLIIDVVRSALDATIQVVICLPSEREATVQQSIQ